jgi:hypothetical protein
MVKATRAVRNKELTNPASGNSLLLAFEVVVDLFDCPAYWVLATLFRFLCP